MTSRQEAGSASSGGVPATRHNGPSPLELAVTAYLDGGDHGSPLIEARSELPAGADLVVVLVVSDGDAAGDGPSRAAGDAARVVPLAQERTLDPRIAARLGSLASPGEAALLAPSDAGAPLELFVGLGPVQGAGRDVMRRAGAVAARHVVVDLRGLAGLAGAAPDGAGRRVPPVAELVQAFVEGFALASYRYEGYPRTGLRRAGDAGTQSRGEGPRRAAAGAERVVLVCEESGAAELGAERGEAVSAAVRLARDLVNTPAADCTPRDVAEVARRVARNEGLAIEVVDAEAAAEQGLGGLLGVARGSSEPPVLVRLAYEPEVDAPPGGRRTVVLVGKGITFDSGGLSLKDPVPMMTMKTDMSGAAAVLGALAACRRLGVDKRVVGLMPLTENMPGGRATKPGDVLTMRNGTTVEVLNTDAEGRLVLADALCLAGEIGPDAVLDLATLTGACVVALGRSIAGLMGTDDALLAAVEEAAGRAGEGVWRLPLPEQYRQQLESEVADLKNIGKPGEAGAVIAGLFLREFATGAPWAHLDIAGPARSEEDSGYLRKGGTGFGVRTLLELLEAPLTSPPGAGPGRPDRPRGVG
jgi:leucyl aminopeptidase